MGVCWGTVVAAELVAAEKGLGMMIMVASKFQSTDIVLMGIILIGIIGFTIDMLMRWAERWLVPWKGQSLKVLNWPRRARFFLKALFYVRTRKHSCNPAFSVWRFCQAQKGCAFAVKHILLSDLKGGI